VVNHVTISNITPPPSKNGAFEASLLFVTSSVPDFILNQSAASLVRLSIEF
jgi:hypothetical protein